MCHKLPAAYKIVLYICEICHMEVIECQSSEKKINSKIYIYLAGSWYAGTHVNGIIHVDQLFLLSHN